MQQKLNFYWSFEGILQSGAADCEKGFVQSFLRVPQVCTAGYCSYHATQASKGYFHILQNLFHNLSPQTVPFMDESCYHRMSATIILDTIAFDSFNDVFLHHATTQRHTRLAVATDSVHSSRTTLCINRRLKSTGVETRVESTHRI